MGFFRTWFGRAVWLAVCAVGAQLAADTLYVCNHGVGTISVVDVVPGNISTSIISPDPLTLLPSYIAAAPNEAKAYVVYEDSDQISAIDLATNSIIKTFAMQGSVDPSDHAMPPLVFTPDGTKLYVIHSADCSVSVIDVASDTESNVLSLGTKEVDVGHSLAVSPDGKWLYATRASPKNGAVEVLDTQTDEIAGEILLQRYPSPGPIAVAPDGLKAYVGEESDVIIVVDLQAKAVVGSIDQGCEPRFITFVPGRSEAYSVLCSGRTRVIDTDHDANTTFLSVPTATQITFSSDGKTAYVCDQLGSQIASVDVASGAVTRKLSGFSYPLGVVVTPLSSPLVGYSPIPAPPEACRAKIKKSSGHRERIVISWKQSPSPRVVRYDIFRDHRKIGSVGATSRLTFSVRAKASRAKRSSKRSLRRLFRKYSIRAVSATGEVSLPGRCRG